jgi:hypothetical protein
MSVGAWHGDGEINAEPTYTVDASGVPACRAVCAGCRLQTVQPSRLVMNLIRGERSGGSVNLIVRRTSQINGTAAIRLRAFLI